MDDQKSLKQQLEMHRRRLAILQVQAAAFGLHVPPHILIEIEDITRKIAELELHPQKAIHAYLKRTLAEFERYGAAPRSWLWGPSGLTAAIEPYQEAAGDQRLVQESDGAE